MDADSIAVRLSALEREVEELRARPTSRSPLSVGVEAGSLLVLHGSDAKTTAGVVLYAGTVHLPDGRAYHWQYGESTVDVFARDWSELSGHLTALGSPVRLHILQAVLRGVTTANALVEDLAAGTSGQVYHHLKELTAAGWLISPRRGTFDISPARIVPLLAILVAAGTPGDASRAVNPTSPSP